MTLTLNQAAVVPTFEDSLKTLWSSFLTMLSSILFKEEEDIDPTVDPIQQEADRRSEATMSSLFGGDDEDDDSEEDDEEDDEDDDSGEDEDDDLEEEDLEEEEDDSEEDSEEEDDDDSEEDEDDDLEEEEDDDAKRESIAQKQARENGRRAKRLQGELDEANIELDNARETITSLEARLAEVSDTFDPSQVPEIRSLQDEMTSDAERTSLRLPTGGANLVTHFPSLIGGYLNMTQLGSHAEKTDAVESLKSSIVQDVAGFNEPYEDLLEDEQAKADVIIDRVLELLERNVSKADKYITTKEELKDKSSEKRITLTVKKYEEGASRVLETLDTVGAVASDVRKADPFSPQSVLSDMVEVDPKAKKKLIRVKKDIVELMQGPRPLTKKEKEAHRKSGKSVKELEKQRLKNHNSKKEKMLTALAESLMLGDSFQEGFKNLKEASEKKAEKDREEELLSKKIRRKKKPSTKKVVKKGRAADRPLAAKGLFD